MSRLGSCQETQRIRDKSLSGEEPGSLLDELKEIVQVACEDGTSDLVLGLMIEVTVRSINTDRPLFNNPFTEPIFYARYFKPWVQETLGKEDVMGQMHAAALRNAL